MNACPKCGAYVAVGATDCAKCGQVFYANIKPARVETASPGGLAGLILIGLLMVEPL
jgi:ribosomal protein L40E